MSNLSKMSAFQLSNFGYTVIYLDFFQRSDKRKEWFYSQVFKSLCPNVMATG